MTENTPEAIDVPDPEVDATAGDDQVENTDAFPAPDDGDQDDVEQDPTTEDDAQAEVDLDEEQPTGGAP